MMETTMDSERPIASADDGNRSQGEDMAGAALAAARHKIEATTQQVRAFEQAYRDREFMLKRQIDSFRDCVNYRARIPDLPSQVGFLRVKRSILQRALDGPHVALAGLKEEVAQTIEPACGRVRELCAWIDRAHQADWLSGATSHQRVALDAAYDAMAELEDRKIELYKAHGATMNELEATLRGLMERSDDDRCSRIDDEARHLTLEVLQLKSEAMLRATAEEILNEDLKEVTQIMHELEESLQEWKHRAEHAEQLAKAEKPK